MAKKLNPVIRKTLLALGLKEYIKTASEDDIANVFTVGAVGMDEGESEGADADEHVKGCKCSDCMDSKGKDAKDSKGMDADERARFHNALDKILDSKDDEQKSMDEDMEQLRGLLAGGASSEKAKTSAIDEDEDNEAEDSDEDEDNEAEDEAVESEASPVLSESERSKSPAPAAVDAATVLKALKPFVAKSGDKRLIKAFDTASKLVRGTTKNTGGSYAAVARASKAVGKDAQDNIDRRTTAQKIADEANEAYKSRRGVNGNKK